MWPKMLFDLLPHLARLMPMADKYLSTRSASEKAQEAALATLSQDIRGELGRSTAVHADLRRQVQEQGTQIAELALDVTRSRMGVESVETRVAKLEKSMAILEVKAGTAMKLLGAVLGMLVIAFALLLFLVAHVVR